MEENPSTHASSGLTDLLKIILEEKTDSSLIGGIKVSYNGVLMDGTVKTRLETLQRQIKGTIA